MQTKLIANSNHQVESKYVFALVERSEGYYSTWLDSKGAEEPVRLPVEQQSKSGKDKYECGQVDE